jgi:phosphoribosylaminoimidazolecarboxamide formyltransferase/IMP cyclohydrolase
MTKRIAVFASGDGTNFQALYDAQASGFLGGEIVLVIASRADAGVIARAKRAGIRTEIVSSRDFPELDARDERMSGLCREERVELVCLAGYMLRLGSKMLEGWRNALMNIHPSLLPAFGGKGMYGEYVHKAVLESGAKVSGCTVHFVTDEYDSGPIIAQDTVPVLESDTPETLAARIHLREHQLYVKTVRLFCEGRLNVNGERAVVLPQKPHDGKVRRALISVSDKTGLANFAKGLAALGVEIVSTSGTAKFLRECGVAVRPLETLTGFPEILGGRVKTLHPMVHGGILLRRASPDQMEEAARLGLEPLDMLIVNLYPFSETLAKHDDAFKQEVIEQIDIGGVALIRAGSKNHEDVAVLTDPSDYTAVLTELQQGGGVLSAKTKRELAVKGFSHTAAYDTAISSGMKKSGGQDTFQPTLHITMKLAQPMRYGENPHQRAALYSPDGKTSFEQLHGKELSYNNILDAAGAWDAVTDFDRPAAVLFKHITPCGAAVAAAPEEAFSKAWECDPQSAFGGVIALNREVSVKVAEMVNSFFVEIVIAPSYNEQALAILSRKKNIRILKMPSGKSTAMVMRSAGRELLVCEADSRISAGPWKTATKRAPTTAELAALEFAWTACKFVRSNAITLCAESSTVGIGAGQMSRVDAVQVAAMKFNQYLVKNQKPQILVMASDAFFPFRDAVDEAAKLGVTAIVHPGGSQNDAQAIAAADEHNIAMMLTGMRHFRH